MNGPPPAGRRFAPALLPIVIITLIIAGCSAPAAATPSSEAATPAPTVEATPEPTPSEEPSPTETEEPSPDADGIGSKVQVGDEQTVTVTALEPWEGNETQQPGADNVFVAVNIRIDAITTTSFTSADFSVEDEDGNSYPEAAPGRSPHLSFQNGLTPDTYYAGFVTFEVPAEAAEELVLVYSPNFLEETYEIELF